MKMKIKQKSGLEFKVLHQELKENTEKINEGIQEGSKLESDKKALEAQIESVYNSDLPYEDKKAILNELKAGIEQLKTEHDSVEKDVKEYQEDNKEILETMDEHAAALDKQKTEMKNIKLESGATDMNKAIDATEKKQQEFDNAAKEYKAKLQASIDTMNAQRRMMMRNKFSGK